MSLNVTLQPEVEEFIRQHARREGITPEEFVARSLAAQWGTAANKQLLTASESDLLLKINEGFSEPFWKRFGELRDKLEAETLTDDERQEFLHHNQQVEAKNAERMSYLLEIARLRGISLPEIMHQLNIGSLQTP